MVKLREDELAIAFAGDHGVDAAYLGRFLQRAATVSAKAGATLRVVGLEPGSLRVRLQATGKSAQAEFSKAPIATTANATAIVAAVAGAIVTAMTITGLFVSPLAKEGAQIIETQDISEIRIETRMKKTTVMTRDIAALVRHLEGKTKAEVRGDTMRVLADMSSKGELNGSVLSVEGELHFRPDGFRFMIPINRRFSAATEDLIPDQHYALKGEIVFRRGQPDSLTVSQATQN